jgi:ADP-ribose pyrophosphatase YjhB (NUDIX family)
MKKEKRYSGILIKHKNKVLLCKRSEKKTRGGEWSIPSGGIENDETPINAAYREFFEETGIEIDEEIQLTSMIAKMTRDGKKMKGLLYVYFCEVDEKFNVDLEFAEDGHEHTECGWFGLNELPTPIGEQLKKVIIKHL